MTVEKFDAIMIGHFAKDRIVFRDTARVASGGAVYYGSMALARLGYKIGVVTRLRREDFPLLDELKEAGISIFATESDQTSGMVNTYFTADRDKRTCAPLGFAGAFREADIPDVEARIFFVVPILAGEVELPLLRTIANRGEVALDAQGFVRFAEEGEVVFRDWEEKDSGLPLVHTLKVDDTEAQVLTGETDLRKAAEVLASHGPKEIVLTHKNGVLVYADGQLFDAAFHPRTVNGRTGRGDTCFAVYTASRLSQTASLAGRYAAAVTSLKMESIGPFDGDAASVNAVLQDETW